MKFNGRMTHLTKKNHLTDVTKNGNTDGSHSLHISMTAHRFYSPANFTCTCLYMHCFLNLICCRNIRAHKKWVRKLKGATWDGH